MKNPFLAEILISDVILLVFHKGLICMYEREIYFKTAEKLYCSERRKYSIAQNKGVFGEKVHQASDLPPIISGHKLASLMTTWRHLGHYLGTTWDN